MTTSSHPWVEEDLRKGLQEANRRWRVAAVVAGHHQECLASLGSDVIDAFEAVLAALGGKTDPAVLGIKEHPFVAAQVQAVIDSTSGEASSD